MYTLKNRISAHLNVQRLIVMVVCCLLPLLAVAGDIYKWEDDAGVWHFSSTPPEDETTFATVESPVSPPQLVSMTQHGTKQEPEYDFFNHLWGPVEIELSLPVAENVISDPPLPARAVLQGQGEGRLLKVKGDDLTKGFRYQLAYKTMIGPPLSDLPAPVDYYPPFPLGMEFGISQGFDNDKTHNEPQSQYAVDIVMPIGTPLLAARSGRVMDLQDHFHGAGQSDRFLARSNQIRILHDDGTMAVYAHLQPNSIRVRPGQLVGTGQWLANSGNTGFSSGPHLHFVIQLNAGMSLESIPFRFHQPQGLTITPAQRMIISGVLPQK